MLGRLSVSRRTALCFHQLSRQCSAVSARDPPLLRACATCNNNTRTPSSRRRNRGSLLHYYNSSSPTSTTTTITRSASKAAQTESEEFSKVHLQEEKAANNNGDDEYTNTLTPWLRQLWDANNDKDTSGNVEPSTIGKSLSLEPSVGKFPPAAAGAVVESEQNDDDDADNDVPVDENVGDDESDESIPNTNDDSFKDPKQSWAIDSLLYPHIRACLSDATFESHELAIRDTGLSVCTLGTGAGNATKLRSNTCTVVCNGGYSYLVDAGEGLQRQFLASRINFRDVRKIFITHMHGDHVFGLPGLLLNMQVSGLHANKQRSIEIYGPVGLYNYIATVLSLTGTELRKLSVEVYELQGGTQRSMRYAGNRKTFPEFHHKGLYRKVIPQNADGTWTLVEPMEITTPELAVKYTSTPTGLSVKAAEIHHIPQLQCFGYTLQEPWSLPRSLDVDAARALGVTSSASYRILKSGFSVMNDDGTRQVHAHQVCGEPARPRKVTVLGDCCLIPPAMEQLALNSDVLIHEATLSIVDKGQKVSMGGHSTAAQAAVFANKVKAKVLVLNHLPKKANKYKGINEFLGEAESRIRGPTRVQMGYDHLEVLIPRRGFEFDGAIPTKSLWFHQRTYYQRTTADFSGNDRADKETIKPVTATLP